MRRLTNLLTTAWADLAGVPPRTWLWLALSVVLEVTAVAAVALVLRLL